MRGDQNFLRYLQGTVQTFNPYGAGEKVYEGGRSSPNLGPTANREGYNERDRMARAKRAAMLRMMKAKQTGKYMNPDALRRRNYQ
jgi:hypothetical protein